MQFRTRLASRTTTGFCLGALVLAGCSSPAAAPAPAATPQAASARPSPAVTAASPIAAEQPVAAETSPAGDIPDNQVFISFTSPTGRYQLQVPEGWARTDNGTDVRFVSKLDGVQVTVTSAATAPTASSVQASAASLLSAARAPQINKVQDVQLPAGPAVLIDYTSNSDPDPVTGKQVRLEDNAYVFYNNGKLATVILWAPLGADNVDQWQQMAESFRWL